MIFLPILIFLYILQLILVFTALNDDIKNKRKRLFQSIWHVLVLMIPMSLYILLVIELIYIPLEHFGIIKTEQK